MNKVKNDPLGYYEILAVNFDAEEKQIKQNYRDLAKKWHPDHNTDPEALDIFQKISVAYDILSDPDKRLVYDLLAQAYCGEKFPDMFSLKVYKNRAGKEDLTVRAVSVWKVIGKIVATESVKSDEVCNYTEARKLLFLTTAGNWLFGWWSLKGFRDNLKALVYNVKKVEHNNKANLRLLLHNAVAFQQENRLENAYLMAQRALYYADPCQQELIRRYMQSLKVEPKVRFPLWNFGMLKAVQFVIPAVLLILSTIPFSGSVVTESDLNRYFAKVKEIAYYQEVKFRTGGETVDDMVVGKVLNIPVDITDAARLYHTAKGLNVMFGPGDDFDVITKLEKNATVRITGMTPDEIWFRVMLDNGDMGFIRREFLKKGIGNEIPFGSKIYKAPAVN